MYLTAHFTLSELGGAGQPPWVVDALRQTAQTLEVIRALLGNHPLRVDSGFRTAAENARVGGVDDSQHLDGSAADVVPWDGNLFAAYGKLAQALQAGTLRVGQLILYADKGHIHVGRPTRNSLNQVLVHDGTSYLPVSADSLARLPGAPGSRAGVLLVLATLGLAASMKG